MLNEIGQITAARVTINTHRRSCAGDSAPRTANHEPSHPDHALSLLTSPPDVSRGSCPAHHITHMIITHNAEKRWSGARKVSCWCQWRVDSAHDVQSTLMVLSESAGPVKSCSAAHHYYILYGGMAVQGICLTRL